MTRISLYALVPYLLTAVTFGTPYFDLIILTVAVISVINFIRRKNIASSAIAIALTITACFTCGNSMSMCNKSFYPLLDEPITLKCVVDETPSVYDGKIQFAARMLSADCRDKSTELNGKVMVFITGDNIEISYGDVLDFKTTLILPNENLNTGGFSYRQYLQSHNIQTICYTKDFSVTNHGVYEDINPVILRIFRLRQTLMEKCDEYFDKDTSAFLKALLLGFKADMSSEMKSTVTRSGISHIVSISGMHLSILMILLNFLIKRLKFRGSVYVAPILNILCALFITALTGFSPSVKRAAAMLIISNAASMVYRENDTLQSLSFAVLILLIANPEAVHDVRLILSAVSVFGIVILNEKLEHLLRRIPASLRETASVTLSAQIISMPFSVLYFNTISVLGIVTNMVILPFIPLLMGMGVAFLISFDAPLSDFLSDGIWLMVNGLLKFAQLIASASFAQLEIGFKKFAYIVVLCTVIIYFMRKTVYCRRLWKNLTCFGISSIAVIMLFYPPISPDINITAINVGQGDCTLIEFPSGKTMLIDGGGDPMSDYDTAENIIRPYLVENGITKIDYAVTSHFHTDHCGGIINLADDFPIGCIIAPDYLKAGDKDNVQKIIEICKNSNIPMYLMGAGDSFCPDTDVDFTVYSPDNKFIYGENDGSMVFKISAFGKSVLFTGDIDHTVRRMLVHSKADIQADLLKAPHHGDYSTADTDFLAAVAPEMAYICVGEGNSYGHPEEETLNLYAKNEILALRTDLDGTIKFKIKPSGELCIK